MKQSSLEATVNVAIANIAAGRNLVVTNVLQAMTRLIQTQDGKSLTSQQAEDLLETIDTIMQQL